MNARIQEIFTSVQGEGKFTGVKQVFVRFAECNLRCDWCDTPKSQTRADPAQRDINHQQLFLEVMEQWENCHSVSLTGGEPLVQTDVIGELLPKFKETGLPVYLESNGILFQELKKIISGIDYIAMDVKLPSSTKCKGYWKEHEEFLRTALARGRDNVFVKAVVTPDTTKEDMEKTVALIDRIDVDVTLVLQPNSKAPQQAALEASLVYQNYCLNYLADVRVIPQWHVLTGIK